MPEKDQPFALFFISPAGADSLAIPHTFGAKNCWEPWPNSEPEHSLKGYWEQPRGLMTKDVSCRLAGVLLKYRAQCLSELCNIYAGTLVQCCSVTPHLSSKMQNIHPACAQNTPPCSSIGCFRPLDEADGSDMVSSRGHDLL